MMELERDRERGLKKPAAISAPDQKRIVENAAVHPHGGVKLRIDNGGCSDDHKVTIGLGAPIQSSNASALLVCFESTYFTLTSLYPPGWLQCSGRSFHAPSPTSAA